MHSLSKVRGALGARLRSITPLHRRDTPQTDASSQADSDALAGIDQTTLQQDLERFTGVLLERINQAAEPLLSAERHELRTEALRQALAYHASALDIATGRYPEVSLLDMLALLILARETLDEYWIPEVFGEAGRPLSEAFARSAEDLWHLSAKVMSSAQQQQVRQVVQAWRRNNPDQRRVEAVRLFSFSEAGRASPAERADERSGLLATVKAATRSADEALLLAERALFLAQRVPFLLRLQTRLGVREIVGDTVSSLDEVGKLARAARRSIAYVGLVVALLIVLFWTGYSVATRLANSGGGSRPAAAAPARR